MRRRLSRCSGDVCFMSAETRKCFEAPAAAAVVVVTLYFAVSDAQFSGSDQRSSNRVFNSECVFSCHGAQVKESRSQLSWDHAWHRVDWIYMVRFQDTHWADSLLNCFNHTVNAHIWLFLTTTAVPSPARFPGVRWSSSYRRRTKAIGDRRVRLTWSQTSLMWRFLKLPLQARITSLVPQSSEAITLS